MTSPLEIGTPYPVFSDQTGSPLENGFIYIGVENMDPMNNPITVYWDKDGLIPAAQPIRTINGYPSRSGTPSQLFCNSAYSILVQNKRGVTVLSNPSSWGNLGNLNAFIAELAGPDGAANVGYLAPYTGAVPTTQDQINSEWISVLRFMTADQIADVINNTATLDVTAEIQAALNYAGVTTWHGSIAASYAKGGATIYFPAGTYKVTSGLIVGGNTRIIAQGPTGRVSNWMTTNTGAIIKAVFSDQNQWVISSATYDANSWAGNGNAVGNPLLYNKYYSAGGMSAGQGGNTTLPQGIIIDGLTINGGGAYGGIRLISSSDSRLENCYVYDTGVNYLLNNCYGVSYTKLRGLYSIHGLAVIACNSTGGDYVYVEGVGTGPAVSSTTTLLSLASFGAGNTANMPDWTNNKVGIYVGAVCFNISMRMHVSENTQVGIAVESAYPFLLDGYTEANTVADVAFAYSCAGQLAGFSNTVNSGASNPKYVFGKLNDVSMVGCSAGAFTVGATSNKIRVFSSSYIDSTDWIWNDAVTFVGLNSFSVAKAGTTTGVFGAITLAEALRRIALTSNPDYAAISDWTININAGDTVATTGTSTWANKRIRFMASSLSTISVGAAGGGNINNWFLDGNCEITFENVNITFPASPAANTGFCGLITTQSTHPVNLRLAIMGGTINLGAAYNLLNVYPSSAMNLQSTFTGAVISAGTNAAILASAGSALICNIQSNCTCAAGVKAFAGTTNGFNGTVLSSNF